MSAVDLIFRTIQPRSPISGLKMSGSDKLLSSIIFNTPSILVGTFTNSVLGFTTSGTNSNTSNLDSPIMPPVRILGFEAEK